MKDSEIEWIGEIPEDWRISAIKNLFNIISGATPKSDVSEYWDGDIVWITPSDYKTEDVFVCQGKRNISLPGLNSCSTTIIPKHSIIFSKRAPIGLVAINEKELCTNQGCLSCVNVSNQNIKYFYYVMSVCTEQFELIGSGTTFKEISASKFAQFSVPLPMLGTQQAISYYLDKKCAAVDRLMENQRLQIEKLKEYKQSLITEAVTKGLDKTVPLKSSGVEWIGDIPNHWVVRKLKTTCKICGRIGFRGYKQSDLVDSGEGAITLSPSNMQNMRLDVTKCSYLSWEKYYESPEIQVRVGDVLFVKTGSTYGKTSIVNFLPIEATINPQIVVLKEISSKSSYLNYFFQTKCLQYQVQISVVGGTIPTISQDKISRYDVVLPPISEQQQIAEYLDKKCAEIDGLISIKQQKIEKLTEYKKSLIYEYVTGKKQVG